jgi:hypothetical protein
VARRGLSKPFLQKIAKETKRLVSACTEFPQAGFSFAFYSETPMALCDLLFKTT